MTNNLFIISKKNLSDFGLAVDSGQEFQETTCGTPLYMAPKFCRANPTQNNVTYGGSYNKL